MWVFKANHIKVVYTPAGCTGELQPFNISANQVYKVELNCQFTHWYDGEIEKEGKVTICMSNILVNAEF